MVLAPFSDWRAGIGTTFIIDLWFSGIIVAGLAFCLIFRKTRIPAVASLVALVGYVGFQYVQRERALEFARQYASSAARRRAHHRASAARVAVQLDRVRERRPGPPLCAHQSGENGTQALHAGRRLHRQDRLALTCRSTRRSGWCAGAMAKWTSDFIEEAWRSEPLAFYRWFADLPAFDGKEKELRVLRRPALRYARARRDAVPLRRVPRRAGRAVAARYFLTLTCCRKRSASCGWLA